MSDSKRITTSERPKYMSEKVCDVCGVKFLGGPRARLCPECSHLYRKRYIYLCGRKRATGEGSRETMRAAAIEYVRAMRKVEAAPAPTMRCGYCGRELGPRDARRGYCARCVARGYHWLHEVTGRTREGAGDELS